MRSLIFLASILPLVSAQDGNETSPPTTTCPDPLAAILATLDCVELEDPVCASNGYNSEAFIKLHNGVDTNTTIDSGGAFWTGAFTLVDLKLDYDHTLNIGPNQASVRYVETVTFTDGTDLGLPASTDYPFGQTFLQHEHALVTVDDDCKMILWDQYGDNQEQRAVDEATTVLLCAVGMMPAEACPFGSSALPPTGGPDENSEDEGELETVNRCPPESKVGPSAALDYYYSLATAMTLVTSLTTLMLFS